MANNTQYIQNLPRGSETSPVPGTSYYEAVDSQRETIGQQQTWSGLTPAEIQTELDNASPGDVLTFVGDVTMDRTWSLNTGEVTVRHIGKIDPAGNDVIKVGDVSQTDRTRVEFDRIVGSDESTTGPAVYEALDGFDNRFKYRKALDVGTVASWRGANGDSNDGQLHAGHTQRVGKFVDIYSQNFAAEGFHIHGGVVFRTEKSVHVRGTGGATGTLTLSGTTLHGSADGGTGKHTDEILHEGNAADSFYMPRYIPDDESLITLDSQSRLIDDKRDYGSVTLAKAGGSSTFRSILDSGGTGRNFIRETGTDGLKIQALNNAPGTEAGILQLDASARLDLIAGGASMKFDGTQANLAGHELKNPNATETADGMTADPESSAEDGYLTIDVGGVKYQSPIYQA